MTRWRATTLGDISVIKGQYGANLPSRPWEPGDPRYVRITDIDADGGLTRARVSIAGSQNDWRKCILKDGDLLFARSGATVGKTYLHGEENDPAVYAGYLIKFELDTAIALPSYVFRYTQTRQYRAWIRASSRAVAQPNINAQQYASLPIPLPPVSEQRRIVAILDRADDLRAKRREALGRLDGLAEAIFTDMFGDVVNNERGWPQVTISNLIEGIDSGKNVNPSEDASPAYRVLKVSAVTSLKYFEHESKPVPTSYTPPANHIVRAGDILFSRANTSELVGATALVHTTNGKTLLPDKLWRIRLNRAMCPAPRFIVGVFQRPSFRRRVSDLATGSSGSMKNISQQKLTSIQIGLPDRDLQQEFEVRAQRIESVRGDVATSASSIDDLFAALQSRAFKGEL